MLEPKEAMLKVDKDCDTWYKVVNIDYYNEEVVLELPVCPEPFSYNIEDVEIVQKSFDFYDIADIRTIQESEETHTPPAYNYMGYWR